MSRPLARDGSDPNCYDVVIMGGGLAGGCLARQLHQEAPHLRTLVVEKRTHPVREAAFKVGESSVEIGAHYFATRLGLEPHLRAQQLEKLGLRYFFTHDDNRDITTRAELGPPDFPPVPSFQLDRGRLENMLLATNSELGIEVMHGCRVSALTLAGDPFFSLHASEGRHSAGIGDQGSGIGDQGSGIGDQGSGIGDQGSGIGDRGAAVGGQGAGSGKTPADEDARHHLTIVGPQGERVVSARWVVDATGRTGLIKRQLGLAQPSTHGANASWWRVGSRVKIDDWSSDPSWKARVSSGRRWQSTVHLMGPGYWVWLIPLGSGSHSFGIVADGDMHPFDRINRFERAMDWLREYEPQCAAVMEAHTHELEDFLALKHFAHGCARVFSPARWALVGEAGVFTDPFYSPGSDFIALGNDYVTDLIVRDMAGESIEERAEAFNVMYLRLFEAFIRLYDGQYPIMGNAQVMTAKISWDNASYWAISALLFFQQRYRRPEFIASLDTLLRRFFVLHARMQAFFRAWHLADDRAYAHTAVNVVDVAFLRVLQADLGAAPMSDEDLRARLHDNFALLERFARAWQAAAATQHPTLARFVSSASDGISLDISALRISEASLPA